MLRLASRERECNIPAKEGEGGGGNAPRRRDYIWRGNWGGPPGFNCCCCCCYARPMGAGTSCSFDWLCMTRINLFALALSFILFLSIYIWLAGCWCRPWKCPSQISVTPFHKTFFFLFLNTFSSYSILHFPLLRILVCVVAFLCLCFFVSRPRLVFNSFSLIFFWGSLSYRALLLSGSRAIILASGRMLLWRYIGEGGLIKIWKDSPLNRSPPHTHKTLSLPRTPFFFFAFFALLRNLISRL